MDFRSLQGALGAVLFICTSLILSVINCTKKSGPAASNNTFAAKTGNTGGASGARGPTISGHKSVQGMPVATPSPIGISGSRDGANKMTEKLKKSGDGTDANNDKKEEDSFEQRKPVIREAKRADEIKKHGPVDQKRKDYKTIRRDLPSSDFDKSLGLPNQDEKDSK